MSAPVAAPLALLSALVVAGAGASSWTVARVVREVGGVPVQSAESAAGTTFAPLLVPLGVVALVLALALWPARGAARRVLGVLTDLTGSAAAVATVLGLLDAGAQGGAGLTAAPWLALLGAVGLMAAGMLAFLSRPAAPMLDERFTVEGVQRPEGDDEWSLAAGDEPDSA